MDRIKDILQDETLSQKMFGKAVVSGAESTTSLLLSKPRSWKQLSKRGTEPFLKMYMWLMDPNGVTKLKAWTDRCKSLVYNTNSSKAYDFDKIIYF